ncbi:site-specific integrase [Vibrio sp. WXL210]|uniref:site-specific integrase n=1 Tax=Vibrio sp. WXL210 TaxID=3450709 RepID=UPI003EC8D386
MLEHHADTNDHGLMSLLTRYMQLEERHVWGFSDGEKKKVLKTLRGCLTKLEAQPQLLRAQQARIRLQRNHASDPISSIEMIESLFDRNMTPFQMADRHLERLPYAKNPDAAYYFEEIRNIAITLSSYLQEFQSRLDVLDLSGAKSIIKEVERFEWLPIEKVGVPLSAEEFDTSECSTFEPAHDQDLRVTLADVGNHVQTTTQKSLDLTEVLASYSREQKIKNTKEKTINAVVKMVSTVHELVGKTNLHDVTRDDVLEAIENLSALPKDRNNPKNVKFFGGVTALESIELNKGFRKDTISLDTVSRHISKCSGVYEWARDHKNLSTNPFKGLSSSIKKNAPTSDKERKKPFTTMDLNEIFTHQVFTQVKVGRSPIDKKRLNYQYWVPLICLLSSMRPNECCQLRKNNVVRKDGVLCFSITDELEDQTLKNKTAKRTIPVHKQLIGLGFEKYLESISEDSLLFPELTFITNSGYYGKPASWFRRHFTEKMDLTKQHKSFYSLRHTFIDFFAKNGEIRPIHRQLIGHLNGDITNDIYGSKYDVKAIKSEVDKVCFEAITQHVKPWS